MDIELEREELRELEAELERARQFLEAGGGTPAELRVAKWIVNRFPSEIDRLRFLLDVATKPLPPKARPVEDFQI